MLTPLKFVEPVNAEEPPKGMTQPTDKTASHERRSVENAPSRPRTSGPSNSRRRDVRLWETHSSAELSAFGSRVATMMLMLRHKATEHHCRWAPGRSHPRMPPGALGPAGLSGAGSSRRNTHPVMDDSLRREATAQRGPARDGRSSTTQAPGVTSRRRARYVGDDRLEAPKCLSR